MNTAFPVNILVHGCNGSTGRFHALAEVLAFHGQQSACLTYNDRDSLMVSSGQLAHAIDTLAAASDFIQKPGTLAAQISRLLKVVTDERDSCRRRNNNGRRIESDHIFSLNEQRHPPVTRAARTTDVEVVAGHVEIVGESGVTPHKLIDVFQREGIVRATPPERQSAFQALLVQLHGQ